MEVSKRIFPKFSLTLELCRIIYACSKILSDFSKNEIKDKPTFEITGFYRFRPVVFGSTVQFENFWLDADFIPENGKIL